MKDNKREDNPKAKAFIEDFFNKYSSSKSDDMAYLMDNPEGLEGTREVSQIREIRLYPKGDDYVAKVEILMKDKDSPLENLEHYTLDITKKDGKYGHMVILFVVGGFLFLVSKGPEQVFNAIAGVWKMIFGG